MRGFHPPTRAWFDARYDQPTPVQARGWETIASGAHALLIAPTGSGKTLAAFLWGIDRLLFGEECVSRGTRILYVSPLKALVHDVERNLRAPLREIVDHARAGGTSAHALRVDVRTGDTSARERVRAGRDPGQILVTTPESLYLLLGSKARENLRGVEAVIVDEIHALAPNKRGAHLALSLERLCALGAREPQRIGLSATVRPAELVAAFLGGTRPVEIVDASARPALDLRVCVPVPDMERVPPPSDAEAAGRSTLWSRQVGAPLAERGIWPALHPRLVEVIRAQRSTILFVNSRGLCERLTRRLNEVAGEELARAHHGSISHEQRAEVELALKEGRLRALVATSSLELGIDMGAVDLVILVESPGSVARGLQRVGRAGHSVGGTSRGLFFPKFRGDLLESAAIVLRMQSGAIEALRIPENALDVLAQQIVAFVCEAPRGVDEIEALVRRAFSYRALSRSALLAVLDMLSGRYPSSEMADLRPRLSFDRTRDVLSARRGTELVARLSGGTIPDRGAFGVHLVEDGPRVGELDEEMVYETRTGDVILLGASSWRVEQITSDRVLVSPAPGESGRLPFWKGEGPGRPLELGRSVGALAREIGARSRDEAVSFLRAQLPLEGFAAENLADYVGEQLEAGGVLPSDRMLVVERFRDQLGDWRVCLLSPFGLAVHAPWAMAVEQRLADEHGLAVQAHATDDGFVLRAGELAQSVTAEAFLLDPEEIDQLVTRALGQTALFSALFRENAVRALLIPRRRPAERHPLWQQRVRTRALLATVAHYHDFPIVLETYRQAMADVFDLAGLKEVLREVQSGVVQVREVETAGASPFARSLVFSFTAAFLYAGDGPPAERRAQALALDEQLLRELLGSAELRQLLDATVLAEIEAELQGLTERDAARDADELGDLLRRIGHLSTSEVAQRCRTDPAEWLELLRAQGRATVIDLAGERRWIAVEDEQRYRSEPEALIARFARSHGPFTTESVAVRFGLTASSAAGYLGALLERGLLVRGEFRPDRAGQEWCDAHVLRRIKQRTLVKVRHSASPVEAGVYARFLLHWQGLAREQGVSAGLERVLRSLEALPLPWSTLVESILPARLADFTTDLLDRESARGRLVWLGERPRGSDDGAIRLIARERVALLHERPAEQAKLSPVQAALVHELECRGASFLTELERAARSADPALTTPDFEAALWELVWAGRITNDTFQPLRALTHTRAPRLSKRGRDFLAGGRWWLVANLHEHEPSAEARALARAELLLDRYGIVAREMAAADGIPGGFGALYRALAALEDVGRVRRGWFVKDFGGVQFALPGALERLRSLRDQVAAEPHALILASTDPANPYGQLIPWPRTSEPLRRSTGAWVALVDGQALAYFVPKSRSLTLLAEDSSLLLPALRALRAWRSPLRRGLTLETLDGQSIRTSPQRALIEAAGFVPDYRGYA